MSKLILALCPNEGNERFIPVTQGSEIVRFETAQAAMEAGEQALLARTHRAFEVWTCGPVYVSETKVIARPSI